MNEQFHTKIVAGWGEDPDEAGENATIKVDRYKSWLTGTQGEVITDIQQNVHTTSHPLYRCIVTVALTITTTTSAPLKVEIGINDTATADIRGLSARLADLDRVTGSRL